MLHEGNREEPAAFPPIAYARQFSEYAQEALSFPQLPSTDVKDPS